MIFILVLLLTLLVIEIVFRRLHQRRYGRPYHVSVKFPWSRSYVTPHPFLSFAYKRHEVIDRNQKLPYALHPNRFYSFKNPLRLNNYGHFGADFNPEKPAGTLRIACLGASTTANNIADEHRDYSYPEILQTLLERRLQESGDERKIEVMNCGIGGWVSVDILVNFLTNIIHLKPDYVILYHGFNDVHLHLMDGFLSDYSHGRKNLGEVIERIKRSSYLPKFRRWHSYECLKDRLFGTGNVRNDVLGMIVKRPPRLDRPFADLTVEQQNFRSLAAVCRHHGVRLILSSFCHYSYDDSLLTKRYGEGVTEENRLMRLLAEELSAPFVDQASLIPADPALFVDSVHFTPEGMTRLAENFCAAVINDLTMREVSA